MSIGSYRKALYRNYGALQKDGRGVVFGPQASLHQASAVPEAVVLGFWSVGAIAVAYYSGLWRRRVSGCLILIMGSHKG